MSLVHWILRRLWSRLSQCLLEVRTTESNSETLVPTPHFLKMIYVHLCSKVDFLFFCPSRTTSFFLLTFSNCHAGIISSFFHSLSTAACASGILIACGIVMNLWCVIELCALPAMWSSWFLGGDGFTRCLVDSWGSTVQAFYVFGTLLDASSLAQFSWELDKLLGFFLCDTAAVHKHFQLSHRIPNNFFVFFVLRINGVSSSIVKFWFLNCPSLLFLVFERLSPVLVPASGRTLFGRVVVWIFVSPSPDLKNPFGGVSFSRVNFSSKKRTLWECHRGLVNLSMMRHESVETRQLEQAKKQPKHKRSATGEFGRTVYEQSGENAKARKRETKLRCRPDWVLSLEYKVELLRGRWRLLEHHQPALRQV